MKLGQFFQYSFLTIGVLGLAACSSTRGAGGSPVVDANQSGANGANGAYAQGTGAGGGYAPAGGCNVPQTAGSSTSSYYFDFDKSDVNSQDISALQSQGQTIATSNAAVKVVGNTDDRGSREYNMALGWRRANAIAAALEQAGVGKQQIATNSNGAEKPIAFGATDQSWACNRRVDIISSK